MKRMTMRFDQTKIEFKDFTIDDVKVEVKYNASWHREKPVNSICPIVFNLEYKILKDLPVSIVGFKVAFNSYQELKDLLFILNKNTKIGETIDALSDKESLDLFIDSVVMPEITTACKTLLDYKSNSLRTLRATGMELLLSNLNIEKAFKEDYGFSHNSLTSSTKHCVSVGNKDLYLGLKNRGLLPVKYTEYYALKITKWLFIDKEKTDFKFYYMFDAGHNDILITDSPSNCQLSYIDNIEQLTNLEKPELFIRVLKGLNRTLYYFHVAWNEKEDKVYFKELEDLFTKNGFEIVSKTKQIKTSASKQTHYIVRSKSAQL